MAHYKKPDFHSALIKILLEFVESSTPLTNPDTDGQDLLTNYIDLYHQLFLMPVSKAINKNHVQYLQVAHQSELLILRQQVRELRLRLDEFLKNSNTSNQIPERIALRVKGNYKFIQSNDLVYVQAQGSYTRVHLVSGEQVLLSKTLKSALTEWNTDDFIRCHQSYAINKKHVVNILSNEGLHLKLNGGYTVPVSRRNKKEVLAILS